MPVAKIACPCCKAGLKSDLPAMGTKKVKCPKCGSSFQAAAPTVTADTQRILAVETLAFPHSPPDALPGIPVATSPIPTGRLVTSGRSATPTLVGRPYQAPPASRGGVKRTALLLIPAVLLFMGGGAALGVYFFAPFLAGTDGQATVAKGTGPGADDKKDQLPDRPADAPPVEKNDGKKELPAPGNPVPPNKREIPEPAPFEPPPPIRPIDQATALTVLPEALQKKVDQAIERGVNHLQKTQQPLGTWHNQGHSLGYCALPALTLLECGVPANDKQIQKAAVYVRNFARSNNATYEMALSILFLDRLGDPKDKALIQSLALRLMAGQNSNGGWTYQCPNLSSGEEKQLLTFLNDNRPQLLSDPLGKDQVDLLDPLGKLSDGPLPTAVPANQPGTLPSSVTDPKPGDKGPGVIPPLQNPTDPKLLPPADGGKPSDKGADKPKRPPLKVENLPPNLRPLPVVQAPGKVRQQKAEHRDDNSNTQFAAMALWVARRHGVPMERTMALIDSRFRVSQHPNGGWGYMFRGPGDSPSMTCVGLLGLAVGHGTANDLRTAAGNQLVAPAGLQQDPAIGKGLQALGQHIEHPGGKPRPGATMPSLYFVWSVERVAVLYQLKTIGKKDWYGWGVELLLPRQQGDGSWFTHSYHGSSPIIDTCLALLFLKRANLVQDLSDSLRLYMGITDPDEMRPQPKR